jgi:hypothetical protein
MGLVKFNDPSKIDFRIYEFYMDYFNERKTYSFHHWSGYIRIKYGTGIRCKLARFWCKILSGFDIFEKNSI